MANNFTTIAQRETAFSPIMMGRTPITKAEVDDLIMERELTVVAFDFAPKLDKAKQPIIDPETGEADVYGVVVFAEYPDRTYGVGKIFTKICKAWMGGFTSAEEASEALAAEGGVRVKFQRSTTSLGNACVKPQILN